MSRDLFPLSYLPSPPLSTHPTRPFSPRRRYKFTSREQNEKSCFSFVLISPCVCIFVYTRAIFSFRGEKRYVFVDELLYKTSFQQTRESGRFVTSLISYVVIRNYDIIIIIIILQPFARDLLGPRSKCIYTRKLLA